MLAMVFISAYGYKSEEVANSVQQGVENVKIAFLMVF